MISRNRFDLGRGRDDDLVHLPSPSRKPVRPAPGGRSPPKSMIRVCPSWGGGSSKRASSTGSFNFTRSYASSSRPRFAASSTQMAKGNLHTRRRAPVREPEAQDRLRDPPRLSALDPCPVRARPQALPPFRLHRFHTHGGALDADLKSGVLGADGKGREPRQKTYEERRRNRDVDQAPEGLLAGPTGRILVAHERVYPKPLSLERCHQDGRPHGAQCFDPRPIRQRQHDDLGGRSAPSRPLVSEPGDSLNGSDSGLVAEELGANSFRVRQAGLARGGHEGAG